MTIANAIRAIESSAPTPSPQSIFRDKQHRLDELVEEAEILVMTESRQLPGTLVEEAATAITAALGRPPVWVRDEITPLSLLDDLLVAEGRLRRQHYHTAFLEFDETD